jgi:hypothetical protein
MKPRYTLLAALAVLPALVSPVLAGPREDMMAGAARCAGIADDRTFLDCYYGAAQPMRAMLGLPPAPGSQQALVPPAGPNRPTASAGSYAPGPSAAPAYAAQPAARPGFWSRLLTHTEQKAEPPTRMASYRFEEGGFFTVTLANGEVWKQATGDTKTARWRNRPETYSVTILPGPDLETKIMKVGNDEMYDVTRVH